jgi:sugar phosphate isomerase/epimerase
LAVGEEPFEFARKVGDRIFNVHLKDYTIHPSPSGYHLVRAALGEGVIDWAAMITLVQKLAPSASFNIELAAIYARHIRLYEDAWWRGYPPRDARELLPTLRYVAQHLQPPGQDVRTPWEAGAPFDACEAYEHDQLTRSIAHLNTLWPHPET